jgi:hypothetical protein
VWHIGSDLPIRAEAAEFGASDSVALPRVGGLLPSPEQGYSIDKRHNTELKVIIRNITKFCLHSESTSPALTVGLTVGDRTMLPMSRGFPSGLQVN